MRRILAVLGGAIALTGCEATFSGAPPASLEPGRDTLGYAISTALNQNNIDNALTFNANFALRDMVVFARMAEIDRLYYAFERNLSQESRDSDLFVAIAGLAAGIGGTLASGGTSQAFSAASAAVAGLNEAFDKNILVERTVASLIMQMRANRAMVKTDIYQRLQLPVDAYPLIAALMDLEAYYQAGTLAAALNGIAETTGQVERAASQRLAETVNDFRVSQAVVVQAGRRTAEVVAPERIATLQQIRDAISAAGDDVVLRLIANPPVASPEVAATIERFGPTAQTEPLIARTALRAALQATNRTEANLAAWASALGL